MAMINNLVATADTATEDASADRSHTASAIGIFDIENADKLINALVQDGQGSSHTGELSETNSTANNSHCSSGSRGHASGGVGHIFASPQARGRAELVLVAFIYGTYGVSSRLIYATEGPPAASTFTLVRQLFANGAFVPLYVASAASRWSPARKEMERARRWGEGAETQTLMESDAGEPAAEARPGKVRPLWRVALELACLNAGFIMLLNAGLVVVPAARAAFLLETSVVITPLISVLAGERVTVHVLGACVLALIGVFLISSSVMSTDGTAGAIEGYAMVMLSALLRSLYIFRLSRTASSYSVLNLQFARALFASVIFAGWFFVDIALVAPSDAPLFGSEWEEALAPLWSGWSSPEVWWLLAYNGIATGTLSVLLQQHGQRVVSASEANVIISTQTVFAVFLGCVLLGEVLVLKEIIGGVLIILGAIWVSMGAIRVSNLCQTE